MKAPRADWVVRILTGVVSFAYYGAWVVAALFLVVGPALKKLAPGLAFDPVYRVGFPVNLPELGATAASGWDVAPLEFQLWWVTGFLSLPTSQLPTWVPIVTYLGLVMIFVLVLLFFHDLRVLFRRVREGAPFDADNATRMRRLGLWLLAFHVLYGGTQYWMSRWFALDLTRRGIPTEPFLDINWFAIFVALVLVGLAEVFRRGATLEEEQSLVV